MGHVPTRDRIMGLITCYCISQAIFSVASLEVADDLVEGPRTADDLAKTRNCSASHLERLMRALCSVGIFSESAEGFELTPLSQHLRRNGEDSVWPLAVFHGDEMYKAFGGLLDNVRTGNAGWETATGLHLWDYLATHPQRGAMFDDSMRIIFENELPAMVDGCDLAGARVVVDVGGGDGSLLRQVLAQHPSASGILFDAPEVIGRARAGTAWNGSAGRCQFVGGDFFAGIPGGGDVYILRRILHDWDDETCVRLLKRCREAMPEHGRLLVIEAVLGINDAGGWARWSDLGVMVFGGQERSLAGYEHLLAAAGFVVARTMSPTTRLNIVEAKVARA